MKKIALAALFLLSAASCGMRAGPSHKVLPDPIITVDGSSSGLFQLGASTFSDGQGCIFRVLSYAGDILEKEPLSTKESYSISVSFQKSYEISGAIGYLDSEGAPLLKEKKMELLWYPASINYDIFDYYGVYEPLELLGNTFDISKIHAPEDSAYVLLGVRFYSRFYGEGKALFYANLN